VARAASTRRRFERTAVRTAAVALLVVLQLALGAPLRALGAAAQRDGEVTADGSRDAVVLRTSEGPFHRLSLHASPVVLPQRLSAIPPDSAASSVSLPRTRSIACVRHAPFAGPRGPPPVIAS